tara:strand:- start:880 stop:1518 length:639 start_codon:yes stop_codon:yes gene_type:complete
MGVDTAEGFGRGDNSVACVIDVETMEQVAEWTDRIDPYLFAEEIVNLANFYDDAFVAVEINMHGLAVVNRIRDLGYWNLYTRRAFDQLQHKPINRIGWQTTTKTKALLLDHARQVLREGEARINSEELLREMRTFMVSDRGVAEARRGASDDRVMAWMIALQAREAVFFEHPPAKVTPDRHVDSWVWDMVDTRSVEEETLARQTNYKYGNDW